jgi:hypothetical protein
MREYEGENQEKTQLKEKSALDCYGKLSTLFILFQITCYLPKIIGSTKDLWLGQQSLVRSNIFLAWSTIFGLVKDL